MGMAPHVPGRSASANETPPASRGGILPANVDDARFGPRAPEHKAPAEWTAASAIAAELDPSLPEPAWQLFTVELIARVALALLGGG